MTAALGMDYDVAYNRITGPKGNIDLEPHVGRVLGRLLETPDQAVSRRELLVALLGDGPDMPGLPLDDLFRKTLKIVRAAVSLLSGTLVTVVDREGELFVICRRQRSGSPPALRKPPAPRVPLASAALRARVEAERQQEATLPSPVSSSSQPHPAAPAATGLPRSTLPPLPSLARPDAPVAPAAPAAAAPPPPPVPPAVMPVAPRPPVPAFTAPTPPPPFPVLVPGR